MKRTDLGRAVLYQGDCINTMEEIPDGSVDGLIIDPPYSSGGTFSTQRKVETGKKYLDTGGGRRAPRNHEDHRPGERGGTAGNGLRIPGIKKATCAWC